MIHSINAGTLLCALLIILLAAAAYAARLLTVLGSITAAAVGLTTLWFGGLQSLALLFLFFASSNLLGLWRRERKKKLGFEKGGRRDQWQVLANGGPATIGLLLGPYLHTQGAHVAVGTVLYAAGLAEANADTWATEIGSASGSAARSILTGKPVATGRSGGVSSAGTAAAGAGSVLIALAFMTLINVPNKWGIGAAIALSGFVGAMVDSVLGATVQAQFQNESGKVSESGGIGLKLVQGFVWLRNDAVNFLGGAIALTVTVIILTILH